ncbi:non-canonical purine NTP pyrophosphatase [Hyalangium rubrum]|uniref:Non-canonical purine NTP pyrophosphatase n=1 Tax=Hyalangium rubrum TaxID=3103134 RepID=A0ABU5HGH9_9BACT|nr:non-canonical purine NTP pyrophosphatase [Hyalangium sp. s54d21]MDY7232564.1 non-canonical purine NTP pyrophosphatase [Hyalangium sp. s54d21]
MPRAFFVTGNQYKAEEISRLLSGLDIVWRKLALPGLEPAAPEQGPIDLAALARRKVLAAWQALGAPCFVETTALELDGVASFTGARFKKQWLAQGEQAFLATHGGCRGRVRVAVAFSEDGVAEHVSVFEGSIEGTLLAAPRGDGGYGWDPAWLPDGYARTLGEMAQQKFFLNMRHRPYLELADRLREHSIGGPYEAHVTIATRSEEDLERFRAFCGAAGVKCIFIELGQGAVRFQPMTASYHHGPLRQALDEVQTFARSLAADGFDVTRLKIEALGTNRDIPEEDAAAKAQPANYFEFHVKVTLPSVGADLEALRARCERHGAHLSRNARKVRADGASERFVTLRIRGLGRANADARFTALLRELAETELPLSYPLREYTVYDSNQGLDRGWGEVLT